MPTPDNPLLDAALSYLQAGISILPCELPNKNPAFRFLPRDEAGKPVWEPWTQEPVSEADVRAWFADPKPPAALGIIGGVVSGHLEVIDIDDAALVKPWTDLVKELDTELFKSLVVERTLRGRIHILYRCESAVPGSMKLAIGSLDEKHKALIETKGEGGYVCAAPSPGYRLLRGAVEALPVITPEQRADLIQISRQFTRASVVTDAPAPPGGKQPDIDGDRPGDEFNRSGDWRAVLLAHGWQCTKRHGDEEGWRRPGKERGGISATWNHVPNAFYVFSTGAHPLEDQKAYSPFALLTILDHDGDYSAAARALRPRPTRCPQPMQDEPPMPSDEDGPPLAGGAQLAPALVEVPLDDADAPPEVGTRALPPVAEAQNVRAQGLRDLVYLDCTDRGNAQAFVALHGDHYRYEKMRERAGRLGSGDWHRWSGHRWMPTDDSREIRDMIQTMDARIDAARLIPDAKAQDAAVKALKAATNAGKLLSALMLASTDEKLIWGRDTKLDPDPMLLGCKNGVLDLRTGDLRDGRPEDMITKTTGVAFRPEAQCPRWERFLLEVFQDDEELVDFVWRAVGYTLTGLTKEQVLFLLIGGGSNGKSVFLDALRLVVGDYGDAASFSTFEDAEKSDRQTNDIAALRGRRLVTASESRQGARVDESRIKAITGEQVVKCRFLFAEYFEYELTYKVWLSANHKPNIRGTDDGIWRRIRLIPFNAKFKGDAIDRDLPNVLAEEAPGILAWAVRGCHAWLEDGLAPPAKVIEATREYREEQDIVGSFLHDYIEEIPGTQIAASAIYLKYTEWASDNGIKHPLTKKRLGQELGLRGYTSEHCRTGRIYRGIQIKSDYDPANDRDFFGD